MIQGKIIAILPQRTGNKRDGGTWVSQEFVLETEEQYPQKICFEVFGEDKITSADLHIEDKVSIDFNFSCREYQGKWYNSIRAWKINKLVAAPEQSTNKPVSAPNSQSPTNNTNADQDGDLPF